MTDQERLDFLDTLCQRTEYLGRGRRWSVSTDMHFSSLGVSIYARSGVGSQCEFQGHGQTVREAIDDAMEQSRV
jgi:hypothetical protein